MSLFTTSAYGLGSGETRSAKVESSVSKRRSIGLVAALQMLRSFLPSITSGGEAMRDLANGYDLMGSRAAL